MSILPSQELDARIREYERMIGDAKSKPAVLEQLKHRDFTEKGAKELMTLAQNYGSWFLIHATALAIALDITDGELGY